MSRGTGIVFHREDVDCDGTNEVYVITNSHVVANEVENKSIFDDTYGSANVVFFFYDDKMDDIGNMTIEGEIVYYNSDLDIALVKVLSGYDHPTVQLASDKEMDSLRRFQEVMTFGCPLGHDPIHTKGEVADTSEWVHGVEMILSTAQVVHGNSGGPLFAKFNGVWKVVGVTSQIFINRGDPVYKMSRSIRIDHVREIVGGSERGQRLFGEEPNDTEDTTPGDDNGTVWLRKNDYGTVPC